MSEERMVFTDMKLSYSKKQEGKLVQAKKRRGLPRHIIIVFLRISCFLLILAITGLKYLFFQRLSECKMQVINDTKGKSTSSQGAQDHSFVLRSTEKYCDLSQGKWSCCGENCYYFSKDEKTWNNSEKSCREKHSSLIKIDDKDEQKFIQSQINFNHWVGLQKKGDNHPWKWLKDNSELSKRLDFQQKSKPDAKCGYLKPTTITTDVCTKMFYYICEKKFTCLVN